MIQTDVVIRSVSAFVLVVSLLCTTSCQPSTIAFNADNASLSDTGVLFQEPTEDTFLNSKTETASHIHVLVITKQEQAATCTQPGSTAERFCQDCGRVIEESQPIPATGHLFATTKGRAATCSKEGVTESKVCYVCGFEEKKAVSIPKADHTVVVLSAVAPTCTKTGLTEGRRCSVCGETIKGQTVVSALGHNPAVVLSAVEPTCTKTGLTEGRRCSTCGETIIKQTVVSALGHNYTPATYTAPATCLRCGATTGTKLSQPTITIRKATALPAVQGGTLRINSATYTTSYNGDGTYDVKVTMSITNLTSTTVVTGGAPSLSGMTTHDGTACTLAAYGSGTNSVWFHNIPGGSYDLCF